MESGQRAVHIGFFFCTEELNGNQFKSSSALTSNAVDGLSGRNESTQCIESILSMIAKIPKTKSADRVELLLRALQVRLLRGQGSLLVRLLRRLVLHVLRVRRAVHRRLAAELVERALRLSLRGLGVRLETSPKLDSRFGTSTATPTLLGSERTAAKRAT